MFSVKPLKPTFKSYLPPLQVSGWLKDSHEISDFMPTKLMTVILATHLLFDSLIVISKSITTVIHMDMISFGYDCRCTVSVWGFISI